MTCIGYGGKCGENKHKQTHTHTENIQCPVKSLDTPTHSVFFIYFNYFLLCRFILNIKTMKEHIWMYVVNKKGVK